MFSSKQHSCGFWSWSSEWDGAAQSWRKCFPIHSNIMSLCKRRPIKSIDVLMSIFFRRGLDCGFVRTFFYNRVYQVEDGSRPDRWHCSDHPPFPAIVLLEVYLPAISAVHCVSMMPVRLCSMLFGNVSMSCVLVGVWVHVWNWVCLMGVLQSCQPQRACLIFFPICRYDICIQKNKPCETLGNAHAHTNQNSNLHKPFPQPWA